MDIALAIDSLVPQAQYGGSVSQNTKAEFDAIVWEDGRTQPTWAEVVATDAQITPMVNWEMDMQNSDSLMSRHTEEIITVLTDAQRAALPLDTFDKHSAKVALRSGKPV